MDGPCFAVFGREELTHMRAAIALHKLYESHVKSSFLGIYWAVAHSLGV